MVVVVAAAGEAERRECACSSLAGMDLRGLASRAGGEGGYPDEGEGDKGGACMPDGSETVPRSCRF